MRDLSEHLGRWTRGRTCLVGVGDVGHGDDAFGVRVVQAVAARWGRAGASPGLPVLIEAGRKPERHLVALVVALVACAAPRPPRYPLHPELRSASGGPIELLGEVAHQMPSPSARICSYVNTGPSTQT